MNVVCLGARIIGVEPAKEIVTAFVNARMDTKPQYQRRLNKVLAIEREA